MSYVWTKGKLTRQYCGSKTQAGTLYKDTTFTYDAYGRRLSKSHTYDTNPVSSSDYSYTYNTTYDYDSSVIEFYKRLKSHSVIIFVLPDTVFRSLALEPLFVS